MAYNTFPFNDGTEAFVDYNLLTFITLHAGQGYLPHWHPPA